MNITPAFSTAELKPKTLLNVDFRIVNLKIASRTF